MDQTPQEIARMQEEIERLKAELEKTGPRVYKEINVFVANWIYEDLDHDDEINALETLFRKQYRCSRFMHYQMGDEEPQKDLTDLLKEEMTGHEGPEILWIFIYTGHGGLTKPGNTLMWAANLLKDTTIFSSAPIQAIFEKSTSDTLLIYDCCNSAVTSGASGTIQETGAVTEVLSACGFDLATHGPGRKSFSHALIAILENPPRNNFSVRQLHSWTLKRLKDTKGKTATPVHTTLTQDGSREIFLQKIADE